MKYGFYDDVNKEYVITKPETPHSWINYLGTKELFGIISNSAGGYTFYKDARLRRLTRYRYNNLPMDIGGRYFYINDGQTLFSPTWQPVREPLDWYECRHGLGYTKISSTKNNLKTEVTYFIPVDDPCELHRVVLENTDSAPKKITLFSMLEFALWNALDDMTNFQRNLSTGEVEVEKSVIYHKTEYRERRNHYAFYSVNTPIDGYDTDRESFFGKYNGFESPEVAINGRAGMSICAGWSPIASHCVNINLEPGEKKELIFVLGYIENEKNKKWSGKNIINKEKAYQLIEKYSSETTKKEFLRLKAYFNCISTKFTVASGDEKFDRMVNIWNPYQCHTTFNISRSASGFESGIGRGIGFRDSNQDLLGSLLFVEPDRAKERILNLAATQFKDGGAFHQYQPLTKKGNADLGGGFNDDPLWLIYAVSAYIKETGDYSLLDDEVAFVDDVVNTYTLMDHLHASVTHVINNKGPHGLPLIGRADWNDCLNLNCFSETPDESFQTCTNKDGKNAESVFIAGMFVHIVPEYITLCRYKQNDAEAAALEKEVALMTEAVETDGYDKEWFLRAYDDAGMKVGSDENREGKIFIEPQGICVMAGIGRENGRAEKALDATMKYLATEHGIKLCYPAFSEYDLRYGEITSYPPGYKENAGIFCHNNSWVIIAEAILGRAEHAFTYYKRITPSYREAISDIHRMEPYVYPQMIAGDDAVRHGEAKNSWLSGTASWMYVAATQYLLGIRAEYDGLVVDPCMPGEFSVIKITRVWRGVTFFITVENRRSGAYELIADNAAVSGKKLMVQPGATSVNVICRT